MTIDIGEKVLTNLTIRFAHQSTFNDPYDSIPPYIVEKFSKVSFLKAIEYCKTLNFCEDILKGLNNDIRLYNSMTQEQIQRQGNEIIKRTRDVINQDQRILSLSSTNEDILMWSHYSKHHTGIVIGFDSNYKFFSKSTEIQYEYIPSKINGDTILGNLEDEEILRNELNKLLNIKYYSWGYENEFRCILPTKQLSDLVDDNFININYDRNIDKYHWLICKKQLNNNFQYIDLPISPIAIKSIYLGAKMNILDENKIINLIKIRLPHVEISKASLDEYDYKINFNRVQ